MDAKILRRLLILAVLAGLVPSRPAAAADGVGKVTVSWDKVTRVSQTTPTLQVVVNPPLRRGTAVHDNAFKSLHALQGDYVRYVPWLQRPRSLGNRDDPSPPSCESTSGAAHGIPQYSAKAKSVSPTATSRCCRPSTM
jgi:hypothetical protein